MRVFARTACLAYWICLTILLLVPDPSGLVGIRRVPVFPWGKFGVHLIAFTALSFLVHATRWPKRPWLLLLMLLMLYGITTETLQMLVPPRTPRVIDGIENCLGVLAGSAIYWLILQIIQPAAKVNLASQLVRCLARDKPAE
jgi:hypothetical protein